MGKQTEAVIASNNCKQRSAGLSFASLTHCKNLHTSRCFSLILSPTPLQLSTENHYMSGRRTESQALHRAPQQRCRRGHVARFEQHIAQEFRISMGRGAKHAPGALQFSMLPCLRSGSAMLRHARVHTGTHDQRDRGWQPPEHNLHPRLRRQRRRITTHAGPLPDCSVARVHTGRARLNLQSPRAAPRVHF